MPCECGGKLRLDSVLEFKDYKVFKTVCENCNAIKRWKVKKETTKRRRIPVEQAETEAVSVPVKKPT